MILITGATGNYGKAAINFLLQKGINANEISALVRSEEKSDDLKSQGISLKTGDYNNYEALVKAFEGIEKLLFISGTDLEHRMQQHKNVINAAKEAKVKHIFYTSFDRKDETESSPISFLVKDHVETEKLIKESNITYTIFKNSIYLDALPMFLGEEVLSNGILLPADYAKFSLALRSDMAEVAVNTMLNEGHENKEYTLSSSESISMDEIAQILSEVTGKEVEYKNLPKEEYKEILEKSGTPKDFIGLLTGFADAIKEGELLSENKDLEKLLGRKPTSAKAFLKEFYTSK